MSMKRLTFAAALIALATACHSSTEPALTDVYMLMSIDGRPLPTTKTNAPSAPVVVHEDLAFDAQGVATRTTTTRASNSSVETVNVVSYEYTRAGSVVTLGNYICTSGFPCALHAPEEGTIQNGVLTMTTVPSLSSPSGPVYVYQRVGPLD
jgi:hypothetical protein